MSDVTGASAAGPGTLPDLPVGEELSTGLTGPTGSPQPSPAQAGSTASASSPAAGSLDAPEPDRCIRCQADLTGDRRSARFCPRCGARRVYLTDEAALLIISDDSPAAAFSEQLIVSETQEAAPPAVMPPPPIPVMPQAIAWAQVNWVQQAVASAAAPAKPQAPTPPQSSNGDIHSLMLLGYANAMYRLGWRYETGLGNGRNPQEALRCYFKAAKLGNTAALSRLAPQCVAGAVPPSINPTPGHEVEAASVPPSLGSGS
jgi:predicted RNA-binding Zn-ribbon protein involved in translation (DUF1610 family)